MTIKFDIPAHVEALFAAEGDPNRSAMEAALVDLYRRDLLTHDQLGAALGLSWHGTEQLLKRHGVPADVSWAEVEADIAALRRVADR